MESDRRALWTALWTDADGDGATDGTSGADGTGSAAGADASASTASTGSFSSFGALPDAPGSAASAGGVSRPGRRGNAGSAAAGAARRGVFGVGGARPGRGPKNVFSLAAQHAHQPRAAMPLASAWLNGALLGRWDNVTGPRVELSWRCDRPPSTPSSSDADLLSASEKASSTTGTTTPSTKTTGIETGTTTTTTMEGEEGNQKNESNESEETTRGEIDTSSGTNNTSNEETITHHVMAGTLEDNLAVKMVVLPHMDSVLCSVAFACEMPDDAPGFPSRLTFALHAGHAHLARVVAAFPVIEEKLLYVATLVRAVAAPSPRQQREQARCLESLARRGVAAPTAPETVDMLSTEIVHVLRSLDAVVTCPGIGPNLDLEIGDCDGTNFDASLSSATRASTSTSTSARTTTRTAAARATALANAQIGARDTEDFGRKLYGATSVFGVDFVSRVLTSHLRTRGHTVVVARDAFVANVLVDVLAPFLAPRDRLLTLRADDRSPAGLPCRCHALYHPDLVLQAVVVPPELSRAASAAAAAAASAPGRRARRRARVPLGLQLVDTELLVQAPLPVTVVDLTGCDAPTDDADDAAGGAGADFNEEGGGPASPHASLGSIGGSAGATVAVEHAQDPGVYQPVSVAAFNTARANYFKYRMCHLPEVVRSTTGTTDAAREYPWLAQPTPPSSPSSSSGAAGTGTGASAGTSPTSSGAAMALSQGNEPFLVPVTEPSRLVHDALCEALGLPAMLRLPYLLSVDRLLLLKAVTLLKLVQSDVESNHGSTEGTGKWLRDNLGLDNDADLNVVFAYAEKICPGIGASMMADRLTLEEKFIELFEGFV